MPTLQPRQPQCPAKLKFILFNRPLQQFNGAPVLHHIFVLVVFPDQVNHVELFDVAVAVVVVGTLVTTRRILERFIGNLVRRIGDGIGVWQLVQNNQQL